MQAGLQKDLNEPFFQPDVNVLRRQLRLQRSKAGQGDQKKGEEPYDIGMVLDVPIELRKKNDGERVQVEIGLPLEDLNAGKNMVEDLPEEDDEVKSPNLSLQGAEEAPPAGSVEDLKMKAHIHEME